MPRAKPRDPEIVLKAPEEPSFQQERSRRSYNALIEAATELFTAHGYDAIGTPEIAEKAGVSVGTFYRYFDDKHEVYIEIARRSFQHAYSITIEKLTPDRFIGKGRHETIAMTIEMLFAYVQESPKLTKSFNEMALRDAGVAELRHAFEQLAVGRLGTLIGLIIPRTVVPDPEATAFVLYGAAMQCAYTAAEHYGTPLVEIERTKAALIAFIEAALFAATR
ncbi:MAG TPA: helix-turn-helix domain-containing protein [Kofleriaceae bacterium]|jgi:AcrR family transcriptional regulator